MELAYVMNSQLGNLFLGLVILCKLNGDNLEYKPPDLLSENHKCCAVLVSKSSHWLPRKKVQLTKSSCAKHGGAYFSAATGSTKDPTAAPGPYENQEV